VPKTIRETYSALWKRLELFIAPPGREQIVAVTHKLWKREKNDKDIYQSSSH
jgi:mRNA deadenylase 3'-5' endonuclease subunit Ccr4